MPVIQEQLTDFHEFPASKLSNGGADSMQQLFDDWQAQREYEETVADVRGGLSDVKAGRVKPVEQAFADIRKKLGLVRFV